MERSALFLSCCLTYPLDDTNRHTRRTYTLRRPHSLAQNPPSIESSPRYTYMLVAWSNRDCTARHGTTEKKEGGGERAPQKNNLRAIIINRRISYFVVSPWDVWNRDKMATTLSTTKLLLMMVTTVCSTETNKEGFTGGRQRIKSTNRDSQEKATGGLFNCTHTHSSRFIFVIIFAQRCFGRKLFANPPHPSPSLTLSLCVCAVLQLFINENRLNAQIFNLFWNLFWFLAAMNVRNVLHSIFVRTANSFSTAFFVFVTSLIADVFCTVRLRQSVSHFTTKMASSSRIWTQKKMKFK